MSYPKIEDHAIVGDLNTAALVCCDGTIDFLCFPYFDSPSIFASLLDDKKGGSFKISPVEKDYNTKQIYISDTNILVTQFLSNKGIVEITDFMPVEQINKGHVLIRKVSAVNEENMFNMKCSPRFNYARSNTEIKRERNDIIFSCEDEKDDISIRLISNTKMEVVEKEGIAEFKLIPGRSVYFILQLVNNDQQKINNIVDFAKQKFDETFGFWTDWISRSRYKGRWQEIVSRSALTLKLMASYQMGSLVAAPTFSLPADIGGTRNFDYRFTWLRDASFMLFTFINLGYKEETKNFIRWFEKHCEGVKGDGELKLIYSLDGSPAPDETELDDFEGYKKSSPVRIGNNATNQLQLDIYGELIDSIYLYDKYAEPISYQLWQHLSHHLNYLTKHWKEKDAGIWEVRGKKQDFLYSKLMCWVAFDRGIKLGQKRSFPIPSSWLEERDKIFNYIYDNFWNEKEKSFVQYKGASNVDGSILLMTIMRFISPYDKMWQTTLKKIEKDLVNDFLVFRYVPEEAAEDGFSGKDGTFNVCSFWYIENLARCGRIDEAYHKFEKMLAFANHVGLYSEQLALSGIQLGNFPQAYTHLGLISCAMSIHKRITSAHKDGFEIEN